MRSHERASRTRVVANLAMSLDGKIDSIGHEGAGFSSRFDRDRMDGIRAEADVLIVGAATIRAEDPPLHVKDPARRHQRKVAGMDEELTVVVVSRRGEIPPNARFLSEPAAARLLVVPEDVPEEGLARLAASVESGALEIQRFGQGDVDVRALVAHLLQAGHRSILIEGGGELLAAFLEHDLVDELRVTLCPTLIGGRDAPTLVGGAGWPLARRRKLQLLAVEQHGDEIFLRYEVTRKSAGQITGESVAMP